MEKPGLIVLVRGVTVCTTLLLFLFLLSNCHSPSTKKQMQTSVKGILHDAAGRPIKEAVVMIIDGSSEFNEIASVTDDSGFFYLSNVTIPGRYVLQIQGSSGSTTTEVNLQNNQPIKVTLQ